METGKYTSSHPERQWDTGQQPSRRNRGPDKLFGDTNIGLMSTRMSFNRSSTSPVNIDPPSPPQDACRRRNPNSSMTPVYVDTPTPSQGTSTELSRSDTDPVYVDTPASSRLANKRTGSSSLRSDLTSEHMIIPTLSREVLEYNVPVKSPQTEEDLVSSRSTSDRDRVSECAV